MKDFARALAGVAEALNEPLSADRIRVYWAILQGYPEDELVQALGQIARESEFFPKPAKIISHMEGEGGNIEAEANLAWARIQAVQESPGQVRVLCEADSRIEAAMAAIGGWYSMRNSGEEPKWMARKFILAFQGKHQSRIKERRNLLPVGSIKGMIDNVAQKLVTGSEIT